MLGSICILFLACSEQEDIKSAMNSAIKGENTVDVSLSLSFAPEVGVENSIDYRPMVTRGEERVQSLIDTIYQCLVMKEINNKWYVDTLMNQLLVDDPETSPLKVTETTSFKDIQLTLRPGHYRILAVLNPGSGAWNPQLLSGAVVKGESDTVACAYTYIFQKNKRFANWGKRQISKEMFAGTAEFSIEKTSDLHSVPINGNTHITFTRKVGQIRFLLKDVDSPRYQFNFNNTQHTVHATLRADRSDKPFCDGLDCWGDAYYNHRKPTTELEICTDLGPDWRSALTFDQYKMISRYVTIYSPFVYADEKTQVPYRLENIKVIGQSGYGGFVYVYNQPIQNLILKNNSIQQVVFCTTDEVDWEVVSPQFQVTLKYLEDESSQRLFDSYYECNIP